MSNEQNKLVVSGTDDIYRGSKNLVLVIYDIVDNKQRVKFVKFIEAYGVRVQKSAFECMLERSLYDKLCKLAPRYIDVTTDSLRIYRLTGSMNVKQWGLTVKMETDDPFVVF